MTTNERVERHFDAKYHWMVSFSVTSIGHQTDIQTGNERWQHLAFDKCSSIDLTPDLNRLARRSRLIDSSYVFCHSFTICIRQAACVNAFAKAMRNEILPNVRKLKMIRDLRLPGTGTPVSQTRKSIENSIASSRHFTLIYVYASSMFQWQFTAAHTFIFVGSGTFFAREKTHQQLLDFLHCSPIMDSLTLFELDKKCHRNDFFQLCCPNCENSPCWSIGIYFILKNRLFLSCDIWQLLCICNCSYPSALQCVV